MSECKDRGTCTLILGESSGTSVIMFYMSGLVLTPEIKKNHLTNEFIIDS